MFAAGVAGDVFAVLWVTTMQREIPEDVLSRVSSNDWFGSLAFAPLGLLLAGPVAARIGVSHALAGCAALVLVATVAALLVPAVRILGTTEDFPPGTGDEFTGAGQCAGR
ncbi:hypothetical protein [Streptomyces avermitilis]|uniref:hypothetical protein n=1 Tax=Streptomyces avermitilis TaxID=33903 RepID=UPI0036BE7FFC